jgi:MFS family permease
MLYYESYVLPSVAPLVLRSFNLSIANYDIILLLSNLVGAISAIFGSLSDRFGRGNLIVYGLLVTGLGTLIVSFTDSLGAFLALIIVLGFIEGIILVVTPALVRDFSPRFGRAFAMGFWTIGPVGGTVLATVMARKTLPTYNNVWQSQYVIAGIVGMVIFLVCFLFLRELAPSIRDQVMNTLKEKDAVEHRAAEIDTEKALEHPWRQMLNPRLVISSVGLPCLGFAVFDRARTLEAVS